MSSAGGGRGNSKYNGAEWESKARRLYKLVEKVQVEEEIVCDEYDSCIIESIPVYVDWLH